MKKVIKQILSKIIRLIVRLLKRNNRLTDFFIQELLIELENNGKFFLSLNKIPKNINLIGLIENTTNTNKKTAIILQGPLVKENSFTLETIKIYQKLYPDLKVIVSTWDNEDSNYIKEIEKEKNTYIVLNHYPKFSGLLNLNYQITTTLSGIKKAKELGIEYVFKSRCDYRFYKKELFNFLNCLLNKFPISGNINYQKYRIICSGSRICSLFNPFWLTDQFAYGYIDDMYNYWNCPLMDYDLPSSKVQQKIKTEHLTWKERSEANIAAEPYLIRNYIERNEGLKPKCNVKTYWEIIKKQFISLSREELGYYWVKYKNKYDEALANGNYFENDSASSCLTYNWNFMYWLLLYENQLTYSPEYEFFAENNRY